MNFYKRHLGDYSRDTGHLGPIEHGVFTLLLDWYYASEQPIPDSKACRIAKASTKAERTAVADILQEFFQRDGDVWRNKRGDEEIAAYHAQAEANRKVAIEREERKRQRKEHEQSTNRATNGATFDPTKDQPSQNPESRIQIQEQEHSVANAVPPNPAATPAGALCARLRSEAGLIQVNPSDPRLLAALAAGVQPDLIVQIAKANPTKPQQYAVAKALGLHTDAASQAAGATHGNPATRGQPARRLSAVERVEARAREAGFEIGDRPAAGRTFDADSA